MSNLGYLPITLVVHTTSTFVIAYIIAVARHDVSAGFPYISDTGSKRPESCVFGQLLNISAFLAFCTMYVRYKVVEAIAYEALDDRRLARLNKVGLALGVLASLGVSMVANFQERTMVEPVHFTGAALAFGPGVIYCFVQTSLSYHMTPRFNGINICKIRLALSLISFMAFIICLCSGTIAFHRWNSANEPPSSKFHWESGDPGFVPHVISTVFEWVMAITFMFFFFTYSREFGKFDLEIVTRPLVRHMDEEVEASVQIPNKNADDHQGAEVANERTRLLGASNV